MTKLIYDENVGKFPRTLEAQRGTAITYHFSAAAIRFSTRLLNVCTHTLIR